ncbi:MAG TPA: hypothetical protein VM327_03245 [Candidatus Thermoplasmatota archaeon]|nr:hypothetical protein [Candidatus Thermoplasmatota archaeon]
MLITRNYQNDGSLRPSCAMTLRPKHLGAYTHHTDHALRHPFGLYNLAEQKVHRGFNQVLSALAPIQATGEQPPGANIDELLFRTESWLGSLLAFIDTGYLVLKALTPRPAKEKRAVFAHQWLERNGFRYGETFGQAVTEYRESFAYTVNQVKHCEVRLAHALAMMDKTTVAGFFLESVDHLGKLAPDIKAHPDHCPTSFNRALRYHLWGVYHVGQALNQAIEQAIGEHHPDARIELSESEDAQQRPAMDLALAIAALPPMFFPGEVDKPTPRVTATEERGNATVSVAYPTKAKGRSHGNARIMVGYTGDGVSKEGVLPSLDGTPHPSVLPPDAGKRP